MQAALWTAPQRLRLQGHLDEELAESFNTACDVWALAVTFYFMLFSSWPFSKDQIRQWRSSGAPEWDHDGAVSCTRAALLALTHAENAPVNLGG